jgi:hypothetical protein
MAAQNLDNPAKRPIVKGNHLNKRTPLAGVRRTHQGLTNHADNDSMEALRNSTSAHPSRQLLSSAVDDFSVSRQVEYCPPPDAVIDQFVRDVCDELGENANSVTTTTETRQGFREFMTVVASIVAKQANARGGQWITQSELDPTSNDK